MDSKMMIRADERTWDVLSNKTFDQLLIHPEIVNRLSAHKFTKPTPVQAGAIPLGLLGNDLLVQAKSGTGKTLVFATLIAHTVRDSAGDGNVVAVVVAPVREIALQIKDVVDKIAPEGTRSCVFIGGEDVKDNKSMLAQGCSVAIGTPGRLAQLLRDGALNFKHSKLFVLDESDKLMDASFAEDVRHIYNSLNPETTQVTAFSATYPNKLDEYLSGFMKTPVTFRLDADDVQLLGIHQYALDAINHRAPSLVCEILDKMSFSQAIVFVNDTESCHSIAKAINDAGKHKAAVMSGSLDQDERKRVVNALKNFAMRIMVSTDVTSRGIDALNVNLVINVGVTKDPETYLHRIGRAGRFGGMGASITMLTNVQDLSKFVRMAQNAKLNVKALEYSNIPYDLTYNEEFFKNSSTFVDHCSKKVENIKAQVSGPSTSQDRSGAASSDAHPLEKENAQKKDTTEATAPAPSPSAVPSTPVEEIPAVSPEVPAIKENQADDKGIVAPSDAAVPSSQGNTGVASRSSSGTSQSSAKTYGGLLAEFTLKKNVPDWNYSEPIKRVEKIEVPLAIVDVEKVRQYLPNFEIDEEEAMAAAIRDRANQPIITGVKYIEPTPRNRRGRGGAPPSADGRGRYEGGRGRGGNFNQDYEGGRGAYSGGRGNQEAGEFSRGSYRPRGYNTGDGGYGRGPRGGAEENSRGGYGRGNFNQSSDGGRGAYSSGRGNGDGAAYGRGLARGGGYNNDAPSRGGYNQDFGDAENSRGAFAQSSGRARGNFNQESQGVQRGGYYGRGAFNQSSDGGRGAYSGGRGNFNQSSDGGRGVYSGSRGNFNQDSEAGENSRGGYGRGAGAGFGRGAVGTSRGGGYNIDGGFGRGGARGGNGGYNNEESNRGSYMGGGRGRGGFGNEEGNGGATFNRGRGGYNQPDEEVSEQSNDFAPRKRFVR